MTSKLARLRENRALQQQLDRAVELHNTGESQEAIVEYRAFLAAMIQRGEAEHPNALIAATNLALLLAASGQAEEAAALCESTTNSYESTYGPYSEKTLESRSNLGRILHTLGRFTEAAAQHEFVLTNADAGSPLAIGSRWQLGYAMSKLGRLDEAESQMRGVVEELTTLDGPTLQARLVLGDLLNEHEKYEEALSEYAAVVAAGAEQELVTRSAHLGRATTLAALGRYGEAEAECELAIAGNHPLDEMARLQRARIRTERGDLEAAEDDLQALWDECENEWGTDAIITWGVREAYGLLLIEVERFDEAVELLTQVAAKWTNVHGPQSTQALRARQALDRATRH
jgi:tetratricopeptide (TPR) repeat protein